MKKKIIERVVTYMDGVSERHKQIPQFPAATEIEVFNFKPMLATTGRSGDIGFAKPRIESTKINVLYTVNSIIYTPFIENHGRDFYFDP